MLALAVVAASELASTNAARAQELRYDTAIDLSVTASGAVLWLTSESLKGHLAPATCRWCDDNALDRGVRVALKWNRPETADTISNVTGFAITPLAAIGTTALAAAHDARSRGIGADALVILEATVLAADFNQLTKFLVGRERPFVHALPPDEKGATSQPSDNNVSFFSGHTTATMAAAVASGTVASMRGYAWAPAVWATGVTLSLGTGYLRIGADKHYFTDVITGAIVGAAIGFAVPYVFHRPESGATGAATGALTTAPPSVLGISGVW
jgi:membrane-associated phospholipid phosphatase